MINAANPGGSSAETGFRLPVQDLDASFAPGALLQEATQIILGAASSGVALESLYKLLRATGHVTAFVLEVFSGRVTRYQPYGQIPSPAAAYQTSSAVPDNHVFVFPGELSNGPAMKMSYVCTAPDAALEMLLRSITGLVAMRLSNETLARQVEEAEDRAQQRISTIATLYEIGQAIDQIENTGLLQLIADRAGSLMDAEACSLMLVHEESGNLRLAASHGMLAEELVREQRIGEGIVGRVAQTEQPTLIVMAPRDSRSADIPLYAENGSSMLVPMKSPEGRLLGVLAVYRRHPASDFTDNDLKLFAVFASQATLALTNKQLYDDLNRRASELLKISTLSRTLISINLEELLERVVEDICALVGFTRCCVFMRELNEANKPIFSARAWRGYPDSIARNPVREREGAIGATAQAKTMRVFDAQESMKTDTVEQRIYLQMRGFARSLGVDSFVTVPILSSKNDCVGVVVADRKGQQEPISAEGLRLLAVFTSQAGIAIENARLHEKTQRLTDYMDNVLQSIGDGILSTDSRGHIVRWNRAAAAILRQPPSSFRNVNLGAVVGNMYLTDVDREQLLEVINRVRVTGERVNLHGITLSPPGCPPVSLNCKLFRLGDLSRERAGVVLMLEDVTQEVQMQAEMERMRRLADIGQLAAKMAHEVRNALAPIKGAAQIIRGEQEAQADSTEWPDIIIAEVNGLSHLTSAMLDFARPTPLDVRAIVVPDFLVAAVQALSSFLVEASVSIQWNIDPRLPKIQADPVQLNQVVRNIVMNAAQSMPNGGTLLVEASFEEESQSVALSFRDTGVGIHTEELEKVFRPFVTTKPKGTGLGLPIVQKIVTHHGGRVEVESTPGEGTCFTVFLPLCPPPASGEHPDAYIPLISARHSGPLPDN